MPRRRNDPVLAGIVMVIAVLASCCGGPLAFLGLIPSRTEQAPNPPTVGVSPPTRHIEAPRQPSRLVAELPPAPAEIPLSLPEAPPASISKPVERPQPVTREW